MHGDRADQKHRTLQYDIYFNDDKSECIAHKRHRFSEALIERAANIGDGWRQSPRGVRSGSVDHR
jgi:hypothetical protein